MMEIEITLNESDSCANCTTEVRNAGQEESQNLDYEAFVSSLEKLQQVMSVLIGLKEFNNLRLCLPCNHILLELDKLVQEFNTLGKMDSVISQIIRAQNVAAATGNMSTAVTLASIDLSNPSSIVIHPHSDIPESNTNIFRDGSENSSIYHITDENSQILKQIQFVSTSAPEALNTTTAEIIGDDSTTTNTTTVVEISHLPKPSITSMDSIWLECGGQPIAQNSASSSAISSNSCNYPHQTAVIITPSTEIQLNEQEQISSSWEIPPTSKTTGIAVPIGGDVLQLYKVLPVLPDKPPFKCVYCQKVKSSLVSLKNHFYNVHEARSLRCEVCEKSFKKPSQLKKHSVIHQEGYLEERKKSSKIRHHKPLLVCSWPDCGRTFKFNVNLNRHSARHRQERPFKCDYENCKKGFKVAGDLKIHMEFHNEVRAYVCHVCGRSYKVKSNLNTHMTNSHSVQGRLRYNAYMRKNSQQRKNKKLMESNQQLKQKNKNSKEEEEVEEMTKGKSKQKDT